MVCKVVLVLVACALFFVCAQAEKDGGAVECAVCTFLVKQVEGYVENNKTEAEILKALESDCSYFGIKSWITTCQELVTSYGPTLIQLVIDDQPADVVCTEVDLCSNLSSTIHSSNKNAVAIIPAKPAPGGDAECGACTFTVGRVETYVEQNKTEEEILGFLEKDCAILRDASWVSACKGVIASDGPALIKLVVDDQPPDVVCKELGFCAKNATAPTRPLTPAAPVVYSSNKIPISVVPPKTSSNKHN